MVAEQAVQDQEVQAQVEAAQARLVVAAQASVALEQEEQAQQVGWELDLVVLVQVALEQAC